MSVTRIAVTELRRGMVIVEDRRRYPVVKLEPCTQRRKVHVNEKWCYDFAGFVNVQG